MRHLAHVLHPRAHGLTPYPVTFRRAESPPLRSMLDEGLWYTHPERGCMSRLHLNGFSLQAVWLFCQKKSSEDFKKVREFLCRLLLFCARGSFCAKPVAG